MENKKFPYHPNWRYSVGHQGGPYYFIEPVIRPLKELLTRFGVNITLTIAAYHTGVKTVRKAGGIPDERTRKFVEGVRPSFSKFEDWEEIFYK